jgi:hypothetical protein
LFLSFAYSTLVATWALSSPPERQLVERVRLRLLPESLGPKGDLRTKVPRDDIIPGGKYEGANYLYEESGLELINIAAICKLIVVFSNLPNVQFVATGWLISENMIVTAGHGVYDWTDVGGFVESVKVYFGYAGPDSVKESGCTSRHGVSAAAPAEYLKASSFVHDVGFVSLRLR